jgi:long-chain acyl-CoA synthetase
MFYARFLETVQRYPSNIAVEMQRSSGAPDGADQIERYTYSELRRMSDSIGYWLTENGVTGGARCAILAANSPRWLATHLGIVAAGNAVVPLDTAFHDDQITKLLVDSGATLIFVDRKFRPLAERAVSDMNVQLVAMEGTDNAGASLEAMFAAGHRNFTPANSGPDDIACILYTSGTTSDPKGVMITHSNLRAEMDAVFQFIRVDQNDALLGVLPLFHALAQMANLLLPMAVGAKVVYLESLNTTELMKALRERDITIFCCVPQFFYLIHDRVFSEAQKKGNATFRAFKAMLTVNRLTRKVSLNLGKFFFKPVHNLLGPKMRYLVTGGSRFDPAIGRDFEALGFTLLQAYGLTEVTGGSHCSRPEHNVMGSIGPPLPGVEAKILDPKPPEDGSGPPVGEIVIRGKTVMKGYYHRPDATTAAIDNDGWFHSGDLGYVDDHGNFFITGRAKEVIVLSSGKNIYPEEIEDYYLKSPWIKEICVLGLEGKPGEPKGERLHGVIVPNFDVLRQKKIVNTREVIRFDIEGISVGLPPTKRLLSYEIWQEDLPRTTTRKLRRFEIEKKVRERQAKNLAGDKPPERELTSEEQDWIQQSDVQKALAFVKKASKVAVPKIHPRDNLELDLGLDSMERVELLTAIEHALGADVKDTAASEVYTVREVIDLVRSHVGKTSAPPAGWDSILNAEVTDPNVLAITRKRYLLDPLWFLFGKAVTLFAKDMFRLEVRGMEKMLEKGPFIISPNHQSFLDAPLVTAVLPWNVFHNVFYVGTSEIFGGGLWRQFAKFLRLIPVDPDANLVPAMQAGAFGLRNGKVLTLYPEGERSIDGLPKPFKKGAAILAHHLNVPIVPVALEGFYEAWPRGKNFQGFNTHMQIEVLDPIYPDPNESAEKAYERITAELRARVVEAWARMHEKRFPKET